MVAQLALRIVLVPGLLVYHASREKAYLGSSPKFGGMGLEVGKHIGKILTKQQDSK